MTTTTPPEIGGIGHSLRRKEDARFLQGAGRYLDDIVLLDDPTILAGVRFAAERMKQVLEPAGAAALAAVLFGRIPIRDGERVCVVASGGNVDLARLGAFFDQAAPLPA